MYLVDIGLFKLFLPVWILANGIFQGIDQFHQSNQISEPRVVHNILLLYF